MKIPEQFRSIPRDEAKLVEVARALSMHTDLIERYRAALAQMPEGKDYWEVDPLAPEPVAVNDAVRAIRGKIRELYPDISNNDCLEAAHIVVDWALGRRSL